jgi:hypothetical protein
MSLELKGTITANVSSYGVKCDNSNDGKTAKVEIDLDLNEEQAKAIGGELFAQTCFSDFVGESAASTVASKKLGHELSIKDEHTIEVEGKTLITKPKVTGLAVSAKERRVTVTVQFPVAGREKSLRHLLDESCGDNLTFVFHGVTQPDIENDTRHGFDTAKGNGAAEAQPSA